MTTSSSAIKAPTQKELFTRALALDAVKADPELVAFFTKKIDQLSARSAKAASGDKKPTAKQIANDGIKGDILGVLDATNGKTVTEIVKALGDDTLTNQKVSALLRQMIEAGDARKDTVKGKSFFYAVDVDIDA